MKAMAGMWPDLIMNQVGFVGNGSAHTGGSRGTRTEDVKGCGGLDQGSSSVAGESGRWLDMFESRVQWICQWIDLGDGAVWEKERN